MRECADVPDGDYFSLSTAKIQHAPREVRINEN